VGFGQLRQSSDLFQWLLAPLSLSVPFLGCLRMCIEAAPCFHLAAQTVGRLRLRLRVARCKQLWGGKAAFAFVSCAFKLQTADKSCRQLLGCCPILAGTSLIPLSLCSLYPFFAHMPLPLEAIVELLFPLRFVCFSHKIIARVMKLIHARGKTPLFCSSSPLPSLLEPLS